MTLISRNIPVIQAHGLTKRLGHQIIFRNLNFKYNGHGIVCICGQNGSGKTTLLSMLAGAVAPDSGDIFVEGCSLVSEHNQTARFVSYVPDDCPIYPFIMGYEWLNFIKAVRICDECIECELIGRFGLEQYLSVRFGAMSLGTTRKFMLIAALMSHAPVLVLDEPTNGLDAGSFEVFRDVLDRRRHDSAIIMTCHDAQQRELLGVDSIELSELEKA